jgi:hypothetical protein
MVGLHVVGIRLKPIRLRNSLYLLIPMEVAKLTGIAQDTKFILTLKHGDECVLMYKKADENLRSDRIIYSQEPQKEYRKWGFRNLEERVLQA